MTAWGGLSRTVMMRLPEVNFNDDKVVDGAHSEMICGGGNTHLI